MKSGKNWFGSAAIVCVVWLMTQGPASSDERKASRQQPTVPVGLDAYRQWDRWPYQRIGVRAYMRSTYDRRGGNEGADASHFLYQLADDFNVTLDVEGRGILYFARYNHWHGSPWHYEVDGKDHIVQESSTADPLHPVKNSVFLPEGLFPAPLAFTWSTTKGADLIWVPISFEDRFRMAYSRTRYGTGYYIFHQFVDGTPLSRPISAWDGKTPPAHDVLELVGRAGSDLVPKADSEGGKRLGMKVAEAKLDKSNGAKGSSTLEMMIKGPAIVRALEMSIPRDQAEAIEQGARLRITWDDRDSPSVDAPIPLFFGAGSLYNRHDREHLVKAFPMNIRFDDERIHLACYFPMPFFKGARIELINGEQELRDVELAVRWMPFDDPANHVGYFHATYQDMPHWPRGQDLVLLDTTKTEGGGDWSGSFVGTSFIFSHNGILHTLEGDPRFFFDDSNSPQAYGTGTEEWGGGGDYWGGNTMTLPLAGHPVGSPDPRRGKPHNDRDKIESAYRFLLADLMPFGKNARIQLEHGGNNTSPEHYESVTYWYGLPAPSLVKTDTLQIGDSASEAAHQYTSPEASEPVEITSRYELGVDTLPDEKDKKKRVEVYPAHTDVGRTTTGKSEFTLKLRPDNLGVMLRRKLDYQYPNQRAEVFVADAEKPDDWQPAGVWYLAGSNTCIYSNPRGELGATQHKVQTSNRRFRDDEFLVPRKLTEGRDAIRVRVKFTPVEVPLFPGHPLGELAWSEIRYDAYCYVMPDFKID